MSDTQKVMDMIKEHDVKYVDFRFTDPRGKWQHLAHHVRTISEELPQRLQDAKEAVDRELTKRHPDFKAATTTARSRMELVSQLAGSIIDAEVSSRERVVGLRTQVALLIDQLEREIESRTNSLERSTPVATKT